MAFLSPSETDLEIWRGIRRERALFLIWWGFVGFAAITGFLLLLVRLSTSYALTAAGLLVVAIISPLLLYWSRKAPPRATHILPKPGSSKEEWLADLRAIGRLLLYQEVSGDLSPELRARIRDARREMGKTLRTKPTAEDLERLSKKLRTGIVAEWKAWRWRQCLPMLKRVRREFLTSDEDPYLLQQQVLWKAVHHTLNLCMPHLLASERILGELACMRLATQTSHQVGEDDISEILLATLYALEWADISMPWEPEAVVRRADAFPLFQTPSATGETGTEAPAAVAAAKPTEEEDEDDMPPLPSPEHVASFSAMAQVDTLPEELTTYLNSPRRRQRRQQDQPQFKNPYPKGRPQAAAKPKKNKPHVGSVLQRVRYSIHAWLLYR